LMKSFRLMTRMTPSLVPQIIGGVRSSNLRFLFLS
jgi:hypothetical protein